LTKATWKSLARLAGALAITAGVALVAVFTMHSRGPDPGPLACGGCPTTVSHLVVADVTRTTFSFNSARLRNAGDQAVTLDDVRLEHATAGLYVARRALSHKPQLNYLKHGHAKPAVYRTRTLGPFRGAVIAPHAHSPARSVVVFFVVPTRVGTYSFSGVIIDYHQGSTEYRATFPDQGRVCLGATTCSSAPVQTPSR
jgi:hypothetical protein